MAEKQGGGQSTFYAESSTDACTDEYILGPIASALITTDVDLNDLATCLGVPFEFAEPERGTKRDKVVKLILQWTLMHCIERSKEKLLNCLRKLKNAAAIEEELKAHDSVPQASVSHPSLTVTIDLPAGLPFTTGNHHAAIPLVSTTEELESAPASEDHFAQHPGHVESAALVNVPQMLVTGFPCQDIRTKTQLFATLTVTRKIADMEERFANIMCDVRKHLQDHHSGDTDDIKLYLTSLTAGIKEDTSPCVFTTHQAAIISYSTLTQIFQWLSMHGFWSFLNFYLLECLVEKYCDESMKERVRSFGRQMEEFKRDMKLSDFLPAWSGRCPHIPSSGFEPIILRVNKDWEGYTLSHVAELEGFLESRFLINRFLFRFANGHYGSVVIMWLVPSHVIVYLKKKLAKIDPKFLSEEGITEVTLGEMKISVQKIQEDTKEACSTIRVGPLPSAKSIAKSLLDHGDYEQLYVTSIKSPDFFWGTLAKQLLQWEEPFNDVMNCNMEEGEIKWFTNGKLNVSVNCVDRHANKHPDRVALIWEKDEPGQDEKVNYRELKKKVCQIANLLKGKGVKKGDLVAIYMPICPLAVASMLACARIGAVHSVLFSRFALIKQAEQRDYILKQRLNGAKVVITANCSPLNGESLKLKESLESVLGSLKVQHVLVFKRTDDEVPMTAGRDEWLEKAMEGQPTECIPEPLNSEDDLFVMYTSGSTGKANGVVHTQAGYLLYVAVTHKYYFDYKSGEVFACDADIGWITGHSYVVYGPLCNGATTVLFDSTAEYPKPSRYWELVEKHKINHFYTTPHVIQKLKSLDKDNATSYDMTSLRIIGSVGDSLHSESWEWLYRQFGQSKCPLIDTWWQTEVGGIGLSPDPRQKPSYYKGGKSMKPSFGVVPCLIDDKVERSGYGVKGNLYLEAPLPGMGRLLTGANGQRNFKEIYFKTINGKHLFDTHDVALRDKDGDYQILGRADDVIRYHGELLNLPKIEGAARASHESIEEAYVVSPITQTSVEVQNVVAHVQVRDQLSPTTKEEVTFNVQRSIEKTTMHKITRDSVGVRIYDNKGLSSHRTISGKTTRHTLRNSEEEVDLKTYQNQGQTSGYRHQYSVTPILMVK